MNATLPKRQRRHVTTVGNDYCRWCERCCEPFDRHVHSNTHQKRINELLDQLATQLVDVPQWIKKPRLLTFDHAGSAGSLQTSQQQQMPLACMFCNITAPVKQDPEKQFQIAGKHILQHLCKGHHTWNVHEFFRIHRLKPDRKSTFILRGSVFEKFKLDASKILKAALAKQPNALTTNESSTICSNVSGNYKASPRKTGKRKHATVLEEDQSSNAHIESLAYGQQSNLAKLAKSSTQNTEYQHQHRRRKIIHVNLVKPSVG
ncbi:hypothetical protein BASA60_010305 [Batrachochytrium salamandrivorans]|nr:hypothetical protein BASA60_010305 [Batrachochytrium salamandrivorans]KAH6567776.1 hypothetical protein BASA62_005896 [Batrachochytrium salamandrivorans]KAH9249954.1 hypothetical protein BASA81_012261 [Batrachochytrium salamandrivorans]